MNVVAYDTDVLQDLIQQLEGYRFTFNFTNSILPIAAYVLLAIGLFAIAQRRNIRHPWMAWVPLANVWLLGGISDQYCQAAENRKCNRKKRMIILSIISLVLAVLVIGAACVLLAQAVSLVLAGEAVENLMGLAASLGLILLLTIPVIVVSIWLQVEIFCAYHDLFCSCTPANKTLYTVLSIVGSLLGLGILASVFVFICRNKDEGMPSRPQSSCVPEENGWL